MGELQPLALAEEVDRVLADHVAAPQGQHPNLARRAWADQALASEAAVLAQIAPEGGGHGFGEPERRPRGRVLLVAVMRLEDLHVEALAQRPRRLLDEAEEELDPHRHVGRVQDRNPLRRLAEQSESRLVETGGSADEWDAALGANPRRDGAALGRGKVDYHVCAAVERAAEVGLHGDSEPGGRLGHAPAGAGPRHHLHLHLRREAEISSPHAPPMPTRTARVIGFRSPGRKAPRAAPPSGLRRRRQRQAHLVIETPHQVERRLHRDGVGFEEEGAVQGVQPHLQLPGPLEFALRAPPAPGRR